MQRAPFTPGGITWAMRSHETFDVETCDIDHPEQPFFLKYRWGNQAKEQALESVRPRKLSWLTWSTRSWLIRRGKQLSMVSFLQF